MEQVNSYEPTLPSGEVIDCKNTMQSYDFAFNCSAPPEETTSVSNRMDTKACGVRSNANSARVANANNIGDNRDVEAIAIVEGKLYTESPESPRPNRTIWWVIGSLVIVSVIVITGVCASGKCSSTNDDPPISTISPFNSTLPPTMSPTETPMELLVERAVSSYINKISYMEEVISVNGTTPESRALAWLIKEDTLFTSSELLTLDSATETEVTFRVSQRYPLVTLWFQQTDEKGAFVRKWNSSVSWLDSSNECEWFGVNCTSIDLGGNVGEQNAVDAIDFYNDNTMTSVGFKGTIPPDIGLLTSLYYLDFKSNEVTGTLPESIRHCNGLQILDLSECLMTGTLPSSIGQMTDIVYFDISDNGFFGTLPSSTEQWRSVKIFAVKNNDLTGSLPDFIAGSTALRNLNFYNNKFAGTIPESIGFLTALTYLEFGFNGLHGTLPFSLGELVNLTIIDVSHNGLTGTIPASIGNWSHIYYAWFDGNHFTGTVPLEVCRYVQPTIDEIRVDCEVNCTCCEYPVAC